MRPFLRRNPRHPYLTGLRPRVSLLHDLYQPIPASHFHEIHDENHAGYPRGERTVLGDAFNASVSGLIDALDTDKEAAVAAPVDDHFSGFWKDDPVGFPHVIYIEHLLYE